MVKNEIRRLVLCLCTIGILLLQSIVSTAKSEKSYWQEWDATRYASAPPRYAYPENFKAYSLHLPALKQVLQNAPMEFTSAAAHSQVLLQVPMPDGRVESFKMVESQVMHPALANAFPDIKTYSGQGTDNPAAILKVSISPLGFHGMILSPDGTVFIDPWEPKRSLDYIVYFKKDFKPYAAFACETDDGFSNKGRTFSPLAAGVANRSHGTTLRNYRLALACTGEYAAYYGGTKAGALAGMVATMNRVNGVYESEVAVRMTLIPNDTLLIYTNASTDPYTNNNGSTMLGQNISTCNSVIGSANYDIGHVFSTGGGGVAYLGVPCTSNKAGGVTGSGSPVGDAFDIDYVAHEMGHQFGGSHTFNASSGSCSGNRSASAAFEPGSGITIMAYAGICGTNDLAPNSIAYFHTYSFDQITSYITTGSGNTCPTAIPTGNTPPVATPAGLNYTIPFQTPFELTASGTDANGDALTYSWEEYDLGASGNWNAPVGDAPIFRPFPPVTSGTRTFPKISDIVNNSTTIGEILPSYARTLKFRITVRDNRIGGGGVMHPDDTIRVNVINTTTPFSVTAPNTALTWTSGQPATVTWNVSGTNLAPISCTSVSILLSTDGGYTYPVTLLASTPNDGSEVITVPANITTTARVRVQALGNIFFDISNVNFSIQSGSSVLSVLNTDPVNTAPICAGLSLPVAFTGDGPANSGNIYTAQLSNSSGSFAAPVNIGTLSSTSASGTITCTIPGGTIQGSGYRVRVVSSNPAITGTDNATNLSIFSTVGAAGIISGTLSVCQGQSGLVYSIPAVTNANSYSWSFPTGFTITAGSTSNSVTVSASAVAVSGAIIVTPFNGCSTGVTSSPLNVTVNLLPASAGMITGPSSVCQGSAGAVYSVPAIANAATYTWTLPSGGSIVAGAGTNTITVNFSAGATSGNISVSGTNSCGMGTSSALAVTVQPAPAAPVITASGSTTVCVPSTVTLSFSPQAGVQYQWRKDGALIAGATDTFYVASVSGNYDVVANIIPVAMQSFNSTGAVSIPDNSCTGGSSDIVVSGYQFPVRSAGIYISMNITHTYLGDLDIFLESPSGARLGISDQTGNTSNGGDNFTNTVIADSGATQIPGSGAPYTGLFKPWSSLFSVSGCTGLSTSLTSFTALGSGSLIPNGTWRLRVYDRFSTDIGTINNWSITFPYLVSSCSVSSNSVSVTILSAPLISAVAPPSGSIGSMVVISGSGFTGATNVAFNGASATYTVVNDGQITATIPPGATTGLLSVSTQCGTVNAPALFTVNTTAALNFTLLIEGFYNSITNQMESVSAPGVSDTVSVELRQATAPYTVVHSSTVALNLQGQGTLTLPGTLIGSSFYLVFRHRNSLETWSKNPVLITAVTNFILSQ